MERQLITTKGYKELKNMLDQLKKKDLIDNIQAIKEARDHGDLSENAEFHAAKEQQAIIASKISYLEKILAEVEIIEPLPEPNGRAVFGAVVEIYDVEADMNYTYQLVGQAESVAKKGRISVYSPIGQALLGKEEGSEVVVNTPGGIRTLNILKISAF